MTQSSASMRERLLNEVVASYLREVDAGESPDRQGLIGRHPEFAAELKAFFADQDRFGRLAAPADSTAGSDWRAADPPPTDPVFLNPARASRQGIGIGSVLGGAYRIFAVKSGGMGRVYLADDLQAAKRDIFLQVAIKSVADFDEWQAARLAKRAPVDRWRYTDLLARFQREALAWIRLGKHDHIILAMQVIEVGAKPYLVMEYADSGDLHSWIHERGLTVPLAVSFAIQFCRGMQYAAGKAGMVHRDIKPANVLIKNDSILKIADFGLAKAFAPEADEQVLGDGGSCDGALSLDGGGTPNYMPPEQFESLSRADTRSDIFSFGAMLYEMLTGRRLFRGGSPAEQYAQRRLPIRRAHEVNPDVPPALSAIVARCVAFAPEDRYASFAELSAELMRVDESLAERTPIPKDDHRLAPEFFTPTVQIEGETFSLISLGQFEAAARRAQQGIDVDPHNPIHWINKSKALAELKDYRGARQCVLRATELRAVDAQAWANLAWTTLALGDAAVAWSEADRATRLDDERADGWICRGCAERQLGRMDEAIASLERGAALEPHNWKAHSNLGFCLLEQGRHGEALAALQTATTINPNDALVWYQIAWLLAAEGQWHEARRAIDKSLQLNESDAEAWGLRGLLLWQGAGDLAAARASLERAMELDPRNDKAQTLLAAMPPAGKVL